MHQEINDPRNHVYPSYKGEPDFCKSVADWFGTRFGVGLDPATEVMAVIGSKDAVSHLPFAFLDPGDYGSSPILDTRCTKRPSDLRART